MDELGYWRQIQREAGSRTDRQTDRKRSRAERREGEAEQQRQYLPGSLQGLWLHAFYHFNFHPGRTRQPCGVRSFNDGLLNCTSAAQAYHLWALRYLCGLKLQSPAGKESIPKDPRITEEQSLSRGKLTHTPQSLTDTVICVLAAT